MANVSPISMKNNIKLSINKVSAKTNSVKVTDLKNYNASEYEEIDYNKQISDLSVDNNIGSIGDINLDGEVDAADETNLQEYLNLDSIERLKSFTMSHHMSSTSQLLEKYKDNPDLKEIINMAYNGETYPRIEQTSDGTYGDTAESIAKKEANEKIIMEFRQAFTDEESGGAGASTIEKFMSYINEEKKFGDINGDGKFDTNDVTTLQKYNQIMNNYKNDKNPTSDPKINTSGNFSDFTDYQNVSFTAIDTLQYLTLGYDAKNLEGLTLKECLEKLKERTDDGYFNYQYKYFEEMVENGFGDYKIIEINKDGGFDATVLQDPQGNYRIFYHSTKEYHGEKNPDLSDYIYDARNVFETQFVNGWIDSFIEDTVDRAGSTAGTIWGATIGSVLMGPVGIFMGSSIGSEIGKETYKKLIDIIRNGISSDTNSDSAQRAAIDLLLGGAGVDNETKNKIMSAIYKGGLNGEYEDQQNKAKALAEKYYNKAASEGKKLSMQGYSLGGSLEEAGYLHVCDKEGADKVLDGLVMFNPYHNNLSDAEVEKIKKAKGLEIYCAEGDMVSSVFNYYDFQDTTKYLYMDYKSLVDLDMQENLGKNYIKDDHGGFRFEQLAGLTSIFGRTHMIQAYSSKHGFENADNVSKAFAQDGSVKTIVKGHVGAVQGLPFVERTKLMFGGDKIANFDDLGKIVISKFVSDNLGVNLTEDDLKDPSKVVDILAAKYTKKQIFSLLASFVVSNATNNTNNT